MSTDLTETTLAALRAILAKRIPIDRDEADGDLHPPTLHEVLWTVDVNGAPWALACDGQMALCMPGDRGEPNDPKIDTGELLPAPIGLPRYSSWACRCCTYSKQGVTFGGEAFTSGENPNNVAA